MVIATGLPFEVVVGFTQEQFQAVQRAMGRHWELLAHVNGIQAMMGGGGKSSGGGDDTELFESKVRNMKKATGKETLSLWEVV